MPQWERSEFQYRAAEKYAEITVFESRLLLCPVGFVLRYNKQGLCVPKSQSKARRCGLSTTEYVKQRALGYEPRGIPPDALFACLEKLGELADKASSPELDIEIRTVLKEITAAFLLPGKG